MKQKIAPTSPKYSLQQQSSGQGAPSHTHGLIKTQGIWYAIFFFFVSILGGAVAYVLLLTYGQYVGLPELSRLIDQASLSSVRTGTREYSEREAAQSSFLESSLTKMLTIYALPEGASLETTTFFTSQQQRGFGVMLTNDGIGMTSMTVIPDASMQYAGQRPDGRTDLLKNVTLDHLSGLVFFKVAGSGLPVVDLSDTSTLPLEEVKTVSRSSTDELFFLHRNSLRKIFNTQRLNESEFIESSEVFFNTYAFTSNIQLSQGSPIFTDDGTLIGLFTGSEGNSSVLYLPERKRIITQYLENRKITYPYLGVRGILLHSIQQTTNVLDLPKNGFLIRTDNEKNIPGIEKNSPAFLSGLQTDDVIVSLSTGTVDQNHSLGQLLLLTGVGQQTELRVLREGSERNVSVTLQELKK